MDITELTVHELQEKLKNKEITITEITESYVNKINEKEKDVEAFITTLTDEALEKARDIQNRFRSDKRRLCRYSNRNKR